VCVCVCMFVRNKGSPLAPAACTLVAGCPAPPSVAVVLRFCYSGLAVTFDKHFSAVTLNEKVVVSDGHTYTHSNTHTHTMYNMCSIREHLEVQTGLIQSGILRTTLLHTA
jgi:hypothetical protein